MTFQACNIAEARHLYDQLAVLTPIMLSLTAAAPIFRGYLADVDCRWNVISGSVDDRTREETGQEVILCPYHALIITSPWRRIEMSSTSRDTIPSIRSCRSIRRFKKSTMI
jgi:hypothetical protein